ncbi:hypothetical protein COCNU_contig69433177G000010 [Cocos nucifera]|nr:hypothetical protein [Cocos nucifera]
MAGADKFGNVYFVRLPQDVSDEIEEDPTGGKIKWEQGRLNGAPNKVEEIVQFHVGDVVACLQKASLIPGGGECVIYGTVMGSLGALLAFTSREDVDFFSHLEMHMRQEHPPLCGRDHMAFRSAYFPVKVSALPTCNYCFYLFVPYNTTLLFCVVARYWVLVIFMLMLYFIMMGDIYLE